MTAPLVHLIKRAFQFFLFCCILSRSLSQRQPGVRGQPGVPSSLNTARARSAHGNLTGLGRQYEAPISISSGLQASYANNPYIRYPNTPNMQIQFPGAPRPPEPPTLNSAGTAVNPYSFGWDMPGNFPNYGGGSYGSNNVNNANNGYVGWSNSGGNSGGYGSSTNNGQMTGNSGVNNYGAQGGSNSGYRPQQGPGSNAYGSNVQNGYIVNSQSNSGNYGGGTSSTSNNGYGYSSNQQTGSSSSAGYGSSGYGGQDSNAGYTARRSCKVDVAPSLTGYCAPRNQLKRKCAYQTTMFSSDCNGKELCCVNPTAAAAGEAITQATSVATSTTATTRTSTLGSSSSTPNPANRFSFNRPVPVQIDVFVNSQNSATTSAPVTTTENLGNRIQIVAAESPITIAQVPAASASDIVNRVQVTVGEAPIVVAPDVNVPAALPPAIVPDIHIANKIQVTIGESPIMVAPDRYCIPDMNPSVIDGVCRNAVTISTDCLGMQSSTSTNCLLTEACCYNMNLGPEDQKQLIQTQAPTTTTQYTVPPTTTSSTTRSTTTSLVIQPVTPAPTTPLPVYFCSPGSYAAIKNGVCTPSSQIGQQCKGKQISPSVDCNRNEFCCFVADAPVGGIAFTGACSPLDNPSIINGKCVDRSDMALACSALRISGSANCQYGQVCCYQNLPEVTTSATTSVLTPRPTIPTTTPQSTTTTVSLATTTRVFRSCQPEDLPHSMILPPGVCVPQNEIRTVCRGIQLGMSLDCGYGEYCCYDNRNSNAGVTAPATIAPGSCTPESDPRINNGFCVEEGALPTRCKGMEASTSWNCNSLTGRYCCFSRTNTTTATTSRTTVATTTRTTPRTTATTARSTTRISSTVSPTTGVTNLPQSTTTQQGSGTGINIPGTACTPQGHPNLVNKGACVYVTNLNPTCIGLLAAPSIACGALEYCCFTNPNAVDIPTPTGNQPCTTGLAGANGSGTCVVLSTAAATCASQEIAPSDDCQRGQACCLFQGGVTSGTGSTTYGSTTSTTTTPSTRATTTGVLTVRPTTAASTSVTTGTSQTMATTQAPSSGKQCSPQNYPLFPDGRCTSVFGLATQCSGMQASPSAECPIYEYCCFSLTTSVTDRPSLPLGMCSPDSRPNITNGMCVNTADLSAQCAGSDIFQSQDCRSNQFCCYREDGNTVTTRLSTNPTTSTTTSSSIGGGTTSGSYYVNQYGNEANQAQAPNQLNADNQGLGQNQPNAYYIYGPGQPGPGQNQQVPSPPHPFDGCTPNSAPDARGVCVDQALIVSRCQGSRLSKAPQCTPYQFCCFNESLSQSTSTSTRGTVTSTIASTSTSTLIYTTSSSQNVPCSPLSSPDVTNGVCADLSQLSTNCRNLQVSKSLQCGQSQYCCFSSTGGQGTTPPSGNGNGSCTPNTSPDSRGTCVDLPQISAKCQGQQMSRSAQCSPSAFCCFISSQASVPSTTPSTIYTASVPANQQCTPNTAFDVTNGMCVALGQISTCQGMRISKSTQCPSTQYCCFSTSPSSGSDTYSTTQTSVTMLTTTPAVPVTSPSMNNNGTGPIKYPSDLDAPSLPQNPFGPCVPTSDASASGRCVDSAQISAQCQGGRLSKSPHCSVYQYCCFGQPPTAPTVPPSTTPRTTSAPVTTRSTSAPTVGPPVYYDNNHPPYGSLTVNPFLPCSPVSEPAVTNGICVDSAQLISKCMSMRASKSVNCMPYQFCCFNGSFTQSQTDGYYDDVTTTTETSPRSVSCSPITAPTVTNGACVVASQISMQCKGQRIAKSGDCKYPDQYCCFSGDSDIGTGTGGTGGSNGTGGTSPMKTCTPVTQPSITNGMCVSSPQLNTVCRDLTFAKSSTCDYDQYCCFNPPVSPGGPTGSGYCSPVSNPSVTNGRCVATSDLTSQCRGNQVSKSISCASGQFCCFTAPSSGSQVLSGGSSSDQNTVSCSPSTQPSIHNGMCVDQSQLSVRCQQLTFSKSFDCDKIGGSQYCCFNSSQSGMTMPTDVNDGATCSPNSEPSSSGACVSMGSLSNQCQNKRMSKSAQCRADQFCCFGGSSNQPGTPGSYGGNGGQTVASGASCSPNTAPSVTNGQCRNADELNVQCRSQRLSKSANCGADQFCCFSGDSDTTGGNQNPGSYGVPSGSLCSPSTAPEVTNGNCRNTEELGTQCQGQQVSKSSGCAVNQFCCFTRQNGTSGMTPPSGNQNGGGPGSGQQPAEGGTCSPSTAPQVSNGRCFGMAQLSTQCQGQRVSKSPNCANSQFCCFTEDLSAVTPGSQCPSGVPQVNCFVEPCRVTSCPSFSNATCQDDFCGGCNARFFVGGQEVTSQCPENLCKDGSRPVNCFVEPCRVTTCPNFPTASCQDDYCGGCNARFFSGGQEVTSQCTSTTTTPATTQTTAAYMVATTISPPRPSGACAPVTSPESTGTCFNQSQLATQCQGQRMAKSPDCLQSQFCCFVDGEPMPQPQGSGCSPSSEPRINNGTCVNLDQMTTVCRGLRVAKSRNCLQSQFCCFGGALSPPDQNQNPYTTTQLTTTSQQPTRGPITECRPLTSPSSTGRCFRSAQLSTLCSNQQFSKSADCPSDQFCCFQRDVVVGQNGSAYGSTACAPNTDLAVYDGVCASTNQLTSTVCAGKRLSKSANCQPQDFCCFGGSSSQAAIKQSFSTGCIPRTDPSVTNGRCVNQSLSESQCQGMRMSKSDQCPGADQFCCFANPPQASPRNPCSPELEPNLRGICLLPADLQADCGNGQRAAKSSDCSTRNQWCCFSGTSGQLASQIKETLSNTGPLVSGTALSESATGNISDILSHISLLGGDGGVPLAVSSTAQVATNPGLFPGVAPGFLTPGAFNITTIKVASVNTTAQEFCRPNSDPRITHGICMKVRELQASCAEKRASPSADCPRFSWCCFDESEGGSTTSTQSTDIALINPIKIDILVNPQVSSVGQVASCTPSTNPSVKDGFCVDASRLTTGCKNFRVSKSSNCPTNEFCCFNSSVAVAEIVVPVPIAPLTATRLTVSTINQSVCTPGDNKQVHNGQCMTMREISNNCVDRRAAPSLDCSIGQWCCYGEPSGTGVKLTASAESLQCAPNSRPTLRNGACMTVRELQEVCVDHQAGPSDDCEMGKWCCYNENGTGAVNKEGIVVAAALTQEVAPQPPVEEPSCIPNAEPQAKDGKCLLTKDLRTKCRNRRVSKSPQCMMGQWCCFTDPQARSFLTENRIQMGRQDILL